ncbi:hypothetical protein [uncultured Bacteroides sp.]|uniref:hypothetical protein n=1 Tax=uncultured Bacteroides sp. TaxID=162156 RepID=UPI002597B2FB|nr:hypothetical protein [uncultured Bacteroides sp.]
MPEHCESSWWSVVRESPKIEAILVDKESQVLQGNLTSFVSPRICWVSVSRNCERDKNKKKGVD